MHDNIRNSKQLISDLDPLISVLHIISNFNKSSHWFKCFYLIILCLWILRFLNWVQKTKRSIMPKIINFSFASMPVHPIRLMSSSLPTALLAIWHVLNQFGDCTCFTHIVKENYILSTFHVPIRGGSSKFNAKIFQYCTSCPSVILIKIFK